MIDMGKLQNTFGLLDTALEGLNEVEKDFTIQQYVNWRNNKKQKQRVSDNIQQMDFKQLFSKLRRDTDGDRKEGEL